MKEVRIVNLGKRFGERVLLQGLSYSFVGPGFYAILGPSGCGKSTLLEMIAGLDVSYSGSLVFEGKDWKKLNEETRGDRRLKLLGYLRQGYDLLELEKALENVILPLKCESDDSSKRLESRGSDLLRMVDLSNKKEAITNTLSGGEKQRVALARSLSLSPRVLLCDEPTGALDNASSSQVFSLLASLGKQRLVILVSHDEDRARAYCDKLLYLQGGALLEKDNSFHRSPPEIASPSFRLQKRKDKPHVSFFFWMKHAYHLSKAKRFRSFLSVSLLTCSLLGLGISFYLSRDVGKEISGAFSSLIGGGKLIMKPSYEDGGAISRAYSPEEGAIREMASSYPGIIESYGISYLADFPSFFPDENEAYIPTGSGGITLDGFSASSPNECLLLKEAANPFYPEAPSFMDEDELALGLPYSSMASLCFSLHIPRDYESLGSYLSFNPLELVFSLENFSWGYSDEQVFSIVAVSQSEAPTLYQLDPVWAQYFYEERLRFPVGDGTASELPWILQRLYYLRPASKEETFLTGLRESGLADSYLFERVSSSFDFSHCPASSICPLSHYYVFLADRSCLELETIASIGKRLSVPYLVCGEDSYLNFPGALMSGFAHPFYAGKDEESLEEVVSYWDHVPLEKADLTPSLPDGVVEGDFKKPASSVLTLDNDFSLLLKGRKPENYDEIVISSSLNEKWGSPSSISVAGLSSSKVNGSYYEAQYRKAELKVVGVASSNDDKLFVPSHWPMDFFALKLGMSSFSLSPTSVIFEIGERESAPLIASLGAEFPECVFSDPSSAISSSTSEVLSFLQLSLSFSSAGSLLIGFMVLLVAGILLARESKNEGLSLYLLGLSRKEIAGCYEALVFVNVSVSAFTASFFLLFAEYLIHKEITANFLSSGMAFSLDFIPFIALFLFAMVAYLLLSLSLRFWVKRRDFFLERG